MLNKMSIFFVVLMYYKIIRWFLLDFIRNNLIDMLFDLIQAVYFALQQGHSIIGAIFWVLLTWMVVKVMNYLLFVRDR